MAPIHWGSFHTLGGGVILGSEEKVVGKQANRQSDQQGTCRLSLPASG